MHYILGKEWRKYCPKKWGEWQRMPQWLKENMFSNLILFSPAPLDYRKIGWNLPEFFRHFVDFSLYLLTGIYGTFPTCCSHTLPWHFLKKIRKLKSYIGGRLKRRSVIISSQKINLKKISCVGSRAGNSLISLKSNERLWAICSNFFG